MLMWLVIACAFVQPTVDEPAPALGEGQLDDIDNLRDELHQSDGGAELWRALDAHGTLMMYRSQGEPTIELASGEVLSPYDPRAQALLAPFSLLPTGELQLAYEAKPELGPGEHPLVATANATIVILDPASRTVRAVYTPDGRWLLHDLTEVNRLLLPRGLTAPDGTEHRVKRYDFASP